MRRPAKLPGRWARVWLAGKAELEARGDWDEVSAALLDRLVLNLREAEGMLAAAAGEPFVAGSTGQMTAHPGWGAARGCEASALAAARQLRLTPATRLAAKDGDDDGIGRDEGPFAALDQLAARRAARAG